MAAAARSLLAAVLLLLSSGLQRSAPQPLCPQPCRCPTAALLNCSSSGLSLPPRPIRDSISQLDLSHNLLLGSVALDHPHPNLQVVHLASNNIARLSLCVEGGGGDAEGWGCESWAPDLRLLSVERNQLHQLPHGLNASKSLQVLQLSFNKISTLQPEDLNNLQNLTELHLQHNLISSLRPQMFQKLTQLRVLDLSFNMLTSLHPLTYLSLRKVEVDVRLDGNQWQCDCSMRSVRRRMASDRRRGLRAGWKVVCAAPSALSGRELLQLDEDDLGCFAKSSPRLHPQDLTVSRGTEVLFSCSGQDSSSSKSSSQASVNQLHFGPIISDVQESDTQFYMCTSQEDKDTVFNLQISKEKGTKRSPRSLPGSSDKIISRDGQNVRNQVRNTDPCNLALAVCLSVFITFLVAFIIGVLARPCIDALWKRITTKKKATETITVSTVEHRQYDNEAFSSVEYPDEVYVHRERRVTFTKINGETSSVTHYDEVAKGEPGFPATGTESSPQQRSQKVKSYNEREKPGRSQVERSSSSSSESSLSSNENQGRKTPTQDALQREARVRSMSREIEMPVGRENEGFSSEPFADWSPHGKHPNRTDSDMWEQDGEPFEFSDSFRSNSRPNSVFDSSHDVRMSVAPPSVKVRKDESSSSSSSDSDGDHMEYTVNYVPDDDEQRTRRPVPPPRTKPREPSSGLLPYGHNLNPQVQFSPAADLSSTSSESDIEGDAKQSIQVGRSAVPSTNLDDTTSNSSIEREVKTKGQVEKQSPKAVYTTGHPLLGSEKESKARATETQWPTLNLEKSRRIKKRLNIKAPSPSSDSSSSSDSDDETARNMNTAATYAPRNPVKVPQRASTKQHTQWPVLDLNRTTPVKRRLDIRARLPSSQSSSSSDSEDEASSRSGVQSPGTLYATRLPLLQSETKGQNLETSWPTLNLEKSTRIKRRLNIKAQSPSTDSSSSSDSEDEEARYVNISHHQKAQWPVLDLNRTTPVKRRLDIRARSPSSHSSSSSDSEDEASSRSGVQSPGTLYATRLPLLGSETKGQNLETPWPTLNLEKSTRIKRRLNIKAHSPSTDSSSSSDSEDEEARYVNISHIQKAQWPVVDLNQTAPVKKRLDIRAQSPSSQSSSSSDSEDEISSHSRVQGPSTLYATRLPLLGSETKGQNLETPWPTLNLEKSTRIKRRLNIKAQSPSTDSSSSSDSEDEETHYVNISHQQRQWPVLDLNQTAPVKRHLDVRAQSPSSKSSSSSDSEDEIFRPLEMQSPKTVYATRLPPLGSETKGQTRETPWPTLNLEKSTRIKRRLNIKAQSNSSDSSSSSDSEDEEARYVNVSHHQQTQWPVVDLNQTAPVKRRLDIRAQSPSSHSSSSSDSEDEISSSLKLQSPKTVYATRLPLLGSETKGQTIALVTQWPTLNLEKSTRIKRRLNVKAPSPSSDSSSSSDSEDETTGRIGQHGSQIKFQSSSSSSEIEDETKQAQRQIYSPGHTHAVSQKRNPSPRGEWPSLNLQNTTRIKRRLDIRAPAPSSDSSSSSDSDDEITGHIQKQNLETVYIAQLPLKEVERKSRAPDAPISGQFHTSAPSSDSSSSSGSEDETQQAQMKTITTPKQPVKLTPTLSVYRKKQWPLLDLQCTKRIKRRLDIKAPSPTPDSSSSSDSEDEGHQGQGAGWPSLDLKRSTRLKRRLDIKANCAVSDSSSSSDSDDEARPGPKQEQFDIFVSSHPVKVPAPERSISQKHSPASNLGKSTDVNANSSSSDSLSSSDSENETTGQMRKQHSEKVYITGLPLQGSAGHIGSPGTQRTTVNIGKITRLKRRLDIRVNSPYLDSSSSSDSEDGMPKLAKQEPSLQVKISQSPATNLSKSPGLKPPLASSDSSSSSSDSENETTGHMKSQHSGKVYIPGAPVPGSKQSLGSEAQWPALKLEKSTRLKKRLDIKVLLPDSTSSSSDSEDESAQYIGRRTHGEPYIQRHSVKVAQAVGPHPQTQSGLQPPQAPSASSDSSSSSDNEDHTSVYRKKPGQVETYVPGQPTIIPQTERIKAHIENPLPNLGQIPRFKRRLAIKVKTQSFSSSSSSDSDNETPKTEKWWPFVDLRNVSRIKRRLDIKVISVTPNLIYRVHSMTVENKRELSVKVSSSSSSSSSDEQEESIKSPKTQIIHTTYTPMPYHSPKSYSNTVFRDKTAGVKTNTTPEINPELESRWATMNLGVSRFRQRLQSGQNANEPTSSPPSTRDTGSVTRRQKRMTVQGTIPTQTVFNSAKSTTDTVDHRLTNRSTGIPSAENNIDVKARSTSSSSSSSSSSDDENGVTRYRREPSHSLERKEESPIIYKRSIFSNSLRLNDSPSPTNNSKPFNGLEVENLSPVPQAFSGMGFADAAQKTIRENKSPSYVDLPSDIKWNGLSREMSKSSVPSPTRYMDVALLGPEQEPSTKTELSPFDFDHSGPSHDTQMATRTSTPTYFTHFSSSSNTPHDFNTLPGNTYDSPLSEPVNRSSRKGLSALKAMSSERRRWDPEDPDAVGYEFDNHAPQFDGLDVDGSLHLQGQPPLISAQIAETQHSDFTHGIPHYRRHVVGRVQSQETPPPVPTTPLPDEDEIKNWTYSHTKRTQPLVGTGVGGQSVDLDEFDPLKSTQSNTPNNISLV